MNAAWCEYGEANSLSIPNSGLGLNYFDICQQVESAEATASALRRVLSKEIQESTLEYPCHDPDHERWFSLRISALDDPLGICALLVHTDISETELSKARLRRLSRLHTVLIQISEALVNTEQPADLYDTTCRIMVEQGLLRMALVAEPCPDTGDVVVVSSHGDTENCFSQLVATSERSQSACATLDTALRTGRHDVCNDVAKHSPMTLWREAALTMGCAANASFPLISSNGKTFGCLTLCAAESHYFQDDEISLMLAIVGDLAFVVESRLKEQDKKLAESLLRESEAAMTAAQRIANFGSWELDLQQEDDIYANPLRWSDGMFRIVGFAPRSVAATNALFFQMVPAEEHEPIRQAVETAVRERAQYSIVHRLIRPDGEERILQETAQVVLDEISGKPIKLIGTAHDITEKRRAERRELADRIESQRSEFALRESEERYRTTASQLVKVLDHSLDVICSFDSEGRFVQLNKACESVWGYTVEELLGTAYIDKVLPQDQERTAKEAKRIMAGRSTQSFENRYRKKNGEITHLQWAAHWSQTEEVMFCVARDITEVKRNAERIAEQASLLDKAQDAILVRDLTHSITYWNQSAERLYGWTAEEVLGRSSLDVLYRDKTRFLKAQSELLAKGEWVGELEHFTKAGESLAVEGHLTLVLDEMGNPKSVLSIGTDLTQRKLMEQQFLRAQRMESLGTLAGGIAHDLNNVLSPILMAVELLKFDESDPERLDTLQLVESSAKRGADTVRQLLSFARGVPGRRIDVHVPLLIKDVVKITRDTYPKNFEIVSVVPDDLWAVQADATQLHQVLLNLCVNARDAMPSGGKITILAENTMVDEDYVATNVEAKVGPHLEISVEDQGTGMEKQVLDQIFDPFFTTKELGKGTGLGLSTTLATVKSHGGFLRVFSEQGVGSKFTIYIPADIDGSKLKEPAQAVELPRGRGQTILVIDDESAILQISKRTLEAVGYRVLLASNGPEGILLYTQNQEEISVVITDMMMPLMDGLTTVRELKRRNPDVRVIGASGINTSAMAGEVSAAGIEHFLAKPYTAETLLQLLRRVIDEESLSNAVSTPGDAFQS